MMNNDLQVIKTLEKALAIIESHPQRWSGERWYSHVSHALGGFCDIVTDNIQIETIDKFSHEEYFAPFSKFALNNPKLSYLFKCNNHFDYIKKNIEHLVATGYIDEYDDKDYNEHSYKKKFISIINYRLV